MPELNLTGMTTANEPYTLLTEINALANNWIGNLLIVGVFVVLFMVFRRAGFKVAITSAAVITAFLGFILRTIGLVSDLVMWVFIIMAAVAVVMRIMQKD